MTPELFNPDIFAKDFARHLRQINMDLDCLKKLPKDQRNEVLQKTMNDLIDIKGVPEFIEAIAFSFIVKYADFLIHEKLGLK